MRPAIAAALFTASCAAPPEAAPPETRVYYCPGGYQFLARAEQESAWLFLPDREVTLPSVPAASGAKYANSDTTFWTKGTEAILDTPEQSRHGCTTQPSSGTWKDARDRGVTFRATGNEPGWIVEIVKGGRTTVVTDYGEHRYEFPTPEPEALDGRLMYRSQSPEVTVSIEREPCRDGMSGFPFQATVELRVGQENYRGCGNWIPQSGQAQP